MNNPSTTREETKERDKEPLKRRLERLRKGPLTCPFCREEFNGLSELFAHVKEHCR
jgi:hypothetical protein